MFCIQEAEDPLADPFASINCDPFAANDSEASNNHIEFDTPSLNIKVYKIDAFENNSNTFQIQTYSDNILPPKLKKNGEIAKKRGPKKGFKRKRADLNNITLNLDKNTSDEDNSDKHSSDKILENRKNSIEQLKEEYLASCSENDKKFLRMFLEGEESVIVSPNGTEFWKIKVDPGDYYPEEPYRMNYCKKRNPKWKDFPYQCEFCGKGYRMANSLQLHAGETHGACSRNVAVPCPCCPSVCPKKRYRSHLAKHAASNGKLYCQYCIPDAMNTEDGQDLQTVLERFPYKKFPHLWYKSEESLRLHRKRKHPYAAFLFRGWEGGWMDNS